MFKVGTEYWLAYGDAESTEIESIKVIEVQGSWIKVESKKLDPMLNMANPYWISAKPRDREAEARAKERFSSVGMVDLADIGREVD